MTLLHPVHIMSWVSINTSLVIKRMYIQPQQGPETELLPIPCFGGDKMKRTTIVPLPTFGHMVVVV